MGMEVSCLVATIRTGTFASRSRTIELCRRAYSVTSLGSSAAPDGHGSEEGGNFHFAPPSKHPGRHVQAHVEVISKYNGRLVAAKSAWPHARWSLVPRAASSNSRTRAWQLFRPAARKICETDARNASTRAYGSASPRRTVRRCLRPTGIKHSSRGSTGTKTARSRSRPMKSASFATFPPSRRRRRCHGPIASRRCSIASSNGSAALSRREGVR